MPASGYGLGAVLVQADDNGVEHPIAFASRLLTDAERHYPVTEQECLAVLFALKRFDEYVAGTSFTVVSDHSALQYLLSMPSPKGRLARWLISIQQYNFKIVHRRGVLNTDADALSRPPVPQPSPDSITAPSVNVTTRSAAAAAAAAAPAAAVPHAVMPAALTAPVAPVHTAVPSPAPVAATPAAATPAV